MSEWFYYENPETGKTVQIYLEEILDVAYDFGDHRDLDQMDDLSFYKYVHVIFDRTIGF